MTELNIRDVVMECLQKGENGIVESPSGTGKTLSLLCASIAWREHEKANVPGVVPPIVYVSRTHTQLARAVRMVKQSDYSHVRVAVLGSRDLMCVNPDLASYTGLTKAAKCKVLVAGEQCPWYVRQSLPVASAWWPEGPVDIEDLVVSGGRSRCCPYHMTRNMAAKADIIFLTHHYLLQPHARSLEHLSLQGSVVIVDEAHNLLNMAEDSAATRLKSSDIQGCLAEVQQGLGSGRMSDPDDVEALQGLRDVLRCLSSAVDEIKLDIIKSGPDKGMGLGTIFRVSFLYELLGKAGITQDMLQTLDSLLPRVSALHALAHRPYFLLSLLEFLHSVFGCQNEGLQLVDKYCRIYIEPELRNEKQKECSKSKCCCLTSKTIYFWCCSPSFAMRSVQREGPRSMVLCSRALAPLGHTVADLGIPIPVRLETPDIIAPSKVSVNVICKGPRGEALVSNYDNRDNEKYFQDLGMALYNFMKVVPGGMLVFFSSYINMKRAITNWDHLDIWAKLCARKPVFVEPQSKEALEEVMSKYTTALQADGSTGAVLMAVLRGKVAEGIDFPNAQFEAVAITGLPFAPKTDPRVTCKQQVLDELYRTEKVLVRAVCQAASRLLRDPSDTGALLQVLTGKAWYEEEPVRAVCQATSRLLRDPSDTGALLQVLTGKAWYEGEPVRAVCQAASRLLRDPSDTGALLQVLTGKAWYEGEPVRAVCQAASRLLRDPSDTGALLQVLTGKAWYEGEPVRTVCQAASRLLRDPSDTVALLQILTGKAWYEGEPVRAVCQAASRLLRDPSDTGALLQILTGKAWYEGEPVRAVCQAASRLLRDPSDTGALLLCDHRFQLPEVRSAMSAWLKPHVVVHQEFGPGYKRVCQFFSQMKTS